MAELRRRWIATLQRIVAALDNAQLVRSSGTGGVRLGPALLKLISSVHTGVVDLMRPKLEARCATTNETMSLSRASGTQLTTIHYTTLSLRASCRAWG
ncbi:transcriptional regulator|nr:transcriptional regulator [Candidatus Pantoea persica]